jgi:hypothetical protein
LADFGNALGPEAEGACGAAQLVAKHNANRSPSKQVHFFMKCLPKTVLFTIPTGITYHLANNPAFTGFVPQKAMDFIFDPG